MVEKIARLPVMAVNLYSTLGKGQFKFDADVGIMRYVIMVLRDILVSDYACPCEFGYDSGDVLHMAHLDALRVDPADYSDLDPSTYAAIKTEVMAERSIYKIADDVVRNYKARCTADQPVSLYFIGSDICVGFRMADSNE